jgi:hypothetical protein
MEENKKSIVEFLGWDTVNGLTYSKLTNYEWVEIEQTKFDEDWNLLMEVVGKIYQTNLYYDKYINSNSSMFTTGKLELSTNKESVYNDCVDFINFYNKQKEE